MFIGLHTNHHRHRTCFSAAMDTLIRANTTEGFIGLTTAGNADRTMRIVDQATPTLELVLMVPGINVLKDKDLSKHAVLNELHRNGRWPISIAPIVEDQLEAEVLADLGQYFPVAWSAISMMDRSLFIPQDIRILAIETATESGTVNVPAISFTYAVPNRQVAVVSIYNDAYPKCITIKPE